MAELNLKGESKLFYYTGGIQAVTLNPGKYKLEVWGAQGGHYTGGKGGYSYGNNFGVKHLGDEYDNIIISNPDVSVEEKAIIDSIKKHH